jgi:predicted esterase
MRPERLVLWGDFLPPDLDWERAAGAWAATDVVTVRGTADPVVGTGERAAAETAAARGAGLRVRAISYEGGHDILEAPLVALAGRPPQSSSPSPPSAT